MTSYTDLAAVVRFHDNGLADARNSSSYMAENTYPLTLGVRPHGSGRSAPRVFGPVGVVPETTNR
ncbi:MAG: hypothetical protein ABSE86_26090 [Bryobacteraceae bacterium]